MKKFAMVALIALFVSNISFAMGGDIIPPKGDSKVLSVIGEGDCGCPCEPA